MTYQSQEVLANAPSLPNLTVGTLTWTDSFEQHPTGTISFTGVKADDLGSITGIYFSGKQVTIADLGFIVRDTGVQGKIYGDGFPVYEVTVNLIGMWQDACERAISLRPITKNGVVKISDVAQAAGVPYRGPQATFSPGTTKNTTLTAVLQAYARRFGCYIRYSGIIGVELFPVNNSPRTALPPSVVIGGSLGGSSASPPVYKDMEVTGPFSITKDTNASRRRRKTQYRPVVPVEKTIVTPADSITSFSVGVPTAGATVLKGLDSNFDNSGPRKTKTTTTSIDATTIKEDVEIWGYAYLASDIAVYENTPAGQIFKELRSDTPDIFWRMVEYRTSVYTYEKVSFSLEIEPAIGLDGKNIPFYIHPDYKDYAAGARGLDPGKNVRYLTGVKTVGWKLTRFVKEQDEGANSWSLLKTDGSSGSANADAKYKKQLVQFFPLPIEAGTNYEIIPSRFFHPDTPAPFTVDYQKISQLDPTIRTALGIESPKDKQTGEITDSVVAIVTPDVSYVEPLLIMNEANFTNGFASTPSLEFNPLKPSPEASFQPTTSRWITTGEESSKWVAREYVDAKQKVYTEINGESTAIESGFTTANQEAVNKVVVGDIPTANAIVQKWELVNLDPVPPNQASTSQSIKRYFASSQENGRLVGSEKQDLPTAETIEEAKTALETELRILGAQSQIDVTVAWYYPDIRAGNIIQLGVGNDARRVMTVTHTLNYRGKMQPLPGVGNGLVLSQGDRLVLGADTSSSVSISTTVSSPDGSDNDGNVREKMKISLSYQGGALGEVIPQDIQWRRNF